jgi:hypothetical protein
VKAYEEFALKSSSLRSPVCPQTFRRQGVHTGENCYNENMETKFHGNGIMEITDNTIIIKGIDDIVDLLSAHNCSSIILQKENMADDFFDLSTGIAGEILQKFSTYRKRLAIIGDFENIHSKSLKDFIYESNKTKQVLFVKTQEAALKIFKQ